MPIAAEIYYHIYQPLAARLPVVLIHGAGGSHLSWPPELRRMAGQRVIALDLPGHGKSSGRGFQSIEAYARAVLEWKQAAEIPRAVFVGHSMGGAIALTLALDNPEAVAGIALIGSAARLPVNPILLEEAASPTTYQNAMDKIMRWSFSPQTSPRLVELVARRLHETRATVLHSDLLACTAFDLSDRLAEIRLPCLVVCGEQDLMTPPRGSQFLADRLPAARLEVIPQAGHMVMLEQPDSVARALTNFMSNIFPGVVLPF